MNEIGLSKYTKALLHQIVKIKEKPHTDDSSKISVSQTVSFFALAYEKIRNVVEYREAHLIRRAAIERILKRRFSMNASGKGEAENVIRELLWARYFNNESLGLNDAAAVQKIIDNHLLINSTINKNNSITVRNYVTQYIYDLMSCEIEETLVPFDSKRESLFRFFLFQIMKNKVKIEQIDEEEKNTSLYIALEKGFSRSDRAYLRYHLFTLSHRPLSAYKEEQIKSLSPKLQGIFHKIDAMIDNPQSESLRRYITKQLAPFHILFDIVKEKKGESEKVIADKKSLWEAIDAMCKVKYAQSQQKLRSLATRSIIYIFLTKMILAIILEYPVSKALFGEVNYMALVINTLVPPALMFVIVALTNIPGAQNTRRIYDRIIEIIDEKQNYETTVNYTAKYRKQVKKSLLLGFSLFYALTFFITFGTLSILLTYLHFNFISKGIFVFFVSVVTFFAYRIRQTAKEYQLPVKDSFYRPFTDFFFLPIVSLGKFLSRGLSRLNFFSLLFDFIIEAPFKLIIEVVEEWISFIRQKREEIV